MRHISSVVSSFACATAIAFIASSAAAHIELVEPAPRYELPANKSCPCGDGDSNRSCNTTAAETHDPARSTSVTTFEAGSTIRVVAEEYIDHPGRMRVAFDPDGADLSDFNQNILMDVADPSDPTITRDNPLVWEFQVQLPDMTCENCTLQVIQAMHGDTENPVLDPAPLSTYYTCADIRLVPKGTLEAGGGTGGVATGGSANAGISGASGSGGEPTAAAGRGGASDDSAAGTGGMPGAVSDDESEEDSGCAFHSGVDGRSYLSALVLIGLAAARRRKR